MYVVISPSSGILFFWTGKEETPSIDHGLLHLQEFEYDRTQDTRFALAGAAAEPRSYFVSIPSSLARRITRTLHRLGKLAWFFMRWRRTFAKGTLWLFVGTVTAAAAMQAQEDIGTDHSSLSAPIQGHDTLAAASALAQALHDEPDFENLTALSGGITQITPLRILATFNDRFAVLPGHLVIPDSLLVTIEIAAQAIYTRQRSGTWTKIAPIKFCRGAATATRTSAGRDSNLFALGPDDLLAVVFKNDDNILPASASLATLPRSHGRPSSCHEDLGKANERL